MLLLCVLFSLTFCLLSIFCSSCPPINLFQYWLYIIFWAIHSLLNWMFPERVNFPLDIILKVIGPPFWWFPLPQIIWVHFWCTNLAGSKNILQHLTNVALMPGITISSYNEMLILASGTGQLYFLIYFLKCLSKVYLFYYFNIQRNIKEYFIITKEKKTKKP